MAEAGEGIELERAATAQPRRLGIRLVALTIVGVMAGLVVWLGSDRSAVDEPEVASRDSIKVPDEDVPRQDLGVSDSPPTTSTISTTPSTASGQARDGHAAEPEGSTPDPGGSPVVTSEPPATTTTLPCTLQLNSYETGCGGFHWTSTPAGNHPMTVGMELLTPNPVVGDELRVRVTASDPDALPTVGPFLHLSTSATPSPASTCARSGQADPIGYGPWDPPPPSPGAVEQVLRYSQTQPPEAGEYILSVCIRSNAWIRTSGADVRCPGDPAVQLFESDHVCRDPYRDLGRPWVRVTIAPSG